MLNTVFFLVISNLIYCIKLRITWSFKHLLCFNISVQNYTPYVYNHGTFWSFNPRFQKNILQYFIVDVLKRRISTDRLISLLCSDFWGCRPECELRAQPELSRSVTHKNTECRQVGVSLGFGSGCCLSRHKLRWMNMSVCSETFLFQNLLWRVRVGRLLRMTPVLSSYLCLVSILYLFYFTGLSVSIFFRKNVCRFSCRCALQKWYFLILYERCHEFMINFQ